jgi:hypothetical protein
MASNSRYTARYLDGDLERDEDDYEDDPDYTIGEDDIEMADGEQRGTSDEGEGSDGNNEGEGSEGGGSEDHPARVILDELGEWTDTGMFLAIKSSIGLNTLRHNSTKHKSD